MSLVTVGYLRASTNRQGTGLEAQRRAVVSFCEARGLSSLEFYVDENQSGAKASRPELDRLMRNVKAGQIGNVVVYSFSRLARSTTHLLEALLTFEALSVGFMSTSENIETKSPMGEAFFTVIAAISQLERELVAERVKNGLVNARAKGKSLGRPRSRPAELIRTLAAQGYSCRNIARLAACSASTVSNELRTPASCVESKFVYVAASADNKCFSHGGRNHE